MQKRESGAESNVKLPHPIQSLVKLAFLVTEFAVEDLSSAKLQPCFLRLQRRTCPCAEHTDDELNYYNYLRISWHIENFIATVS